MTKTRKNKIKLNKLSKGGSVIDSGGFGCIFRPALKCKNIKKTTQPGELITKLMKKKYARKEYNEVMKFYKLLKDIPNFADYFLVEDYSICEPDKLSKSDLTDFNKKCKALKKIDINENNINEPEFMDKLLALNMPYGGIDAGKFIDDNWKNPKEMIKLNNALIKLLQFGIIPMNKAGVFHSDLKSSNILVREENDRLYARLIDWGLSASYTSDGSQIPKVLLNRPFQYNIPYSNILFNSLFSKMYKAFLEKNPAPDYYTLRTFVINYVLKWVEERGPGHLKTMNVICQNLFGNEFKNIDDSFKGDLIEYDFTFYFIFEYITKILQKFTKDGEFDTITYFTEVFLKNVDVWGLVLSYIPIVENILNSKISKKYLSSKNNIINRIKELMLILIYSSDYAINVTLVLEKLHDLNSLFVYLNKDTHHMTSTSDFSEKHATAIASAPIKESIKETINENKSMSKKNISVAGSLSLATRKKIKKKKFHKMIIKTLRNIKNTHSRRAWL